MAQNALTNGAILLRSEPNFDFVLIRVSILSQYRDSVTPASTRHRCDSIGVNQSEHKFTFARIILILYTCSMNRSFKVTTSDINVKHLFRKCIEILCVINSSFKVTI